MGVRKRLMQMTSGRSLMVKIPVATREVIAHESLKPVDSWLHRLKDSGTGGVLGEEGLGFLITPEQ